MLLTLSSGSWVVVVGDNYATTIGNKGHDVVEQARDDSSRILDWGVKFAKRGAS